MSFKASIPAQTSVSEDRKVGKDGAKNHPAPRIYESLVLDKRIQNSNNQGLISKNGGRCSFSRRVH
jgi:hypothetical protein